jgi:hypothetical protein
VTDLPMNIGFANAAKVRFGRIRLLPKQQVVLRQMNRWVTELCRRVPAPLRDQAALAVQRRLTRSRTNGLANFFDQYYPPAWTVLYWLAEGARSELVQTLLVPAVKAQAAALFLHQIDDHIVDGQIPIDHLILQLRTQAWMSFQEDLDYLTARIEGGPEIASGMIEDYFVSVHQPSECHSLADFDAAYRGQAATTLVTFVLLAQAGGYDHREVLAMAEFGVLAWRHLDDLRDWIGDARAGDATGLYHLLSDRGQAAWRNCRGMPADHPAWQSLQEELHDLDGRGALTYIENYLNVGAAAANALSLLGLAQEFHVLAAPLKEAFSP